MLAIRWLLVVLFTVVMWAPAQAEGQRVILVLDASGSMWGQIDGRAKIDIAKDVVGKVISTWKPEDEIGLVAYGHRKKGDCGDIETLIEPGALDAGRFMAAVKALSPKGKTPMTQSVRQAAEALKFTEKQATVILVSDGIETCDPNPCAVAEELEKMGVGLTVHTVGFGLDDKGAVAQLQCLADKTGGISVIADNADQLEEALTKTVQTEPAPPPQPVAPEFNFIGRVVMAEGVDLPAQFDAPTWEVFQSANGERGAVSKTEYGNPLKTNVEPDGDYIVQVSKDLAKVSAPVKIEAGKLAEVALSFEAGLTTFTGKMDEATPLTSDSTTWELLDANGQWLATKYGPEVQFLAPAGGYNMRLSLGTAKIEQAVTFTAGKTESVVMTLGAGVLEVSAVFTSGGQPVLDGAAVELQKGEPNVDGKHEWIGTNYGPAVKFDVPAGKYRVAVTQDYATGFGDAEVKAGAVTKIEVSVNGGFLAVTSAGDTAIEVYSGEKDVSGNRRWIATGYNGQLNKAFNAGVLRVIAKKQDGTVIGERDFEVKAGQRTEGTIP